MLGKTRIFLGQSQNISLLTVAAIVNLTQFTESSFPQSTQEGPGDPCSQSKLSYRSETMNLRNPKAIHMQQACLTVLGKDTIFQRCSLHNYNWKDSWEQKLSVPDVKFLHLETLEMDSQPSINSSLVLLFRKLRLWKVKWYFRKIQLINIRFGVRPRCSGLKSGW